MGALLFALIALIPAVPSQTVEASAVRAAVAELGSFDFATRTSAAQLIRRAPTAVTAPILRDTVQNGADEYAQFRAFVLLTTVDHQAAAMTAARVLTSRDDRLRTVAYQWFEHYPDAAITPKLVDALSTEQSEFVRPSLMRALAAVAAVEAPVEVRQALESLALRGEDLFRGATIQALGDYRGRYALAAISSVAELDGPLQDDAITALGRLGDSASRPLLTRLQERVPRDLQPTVSSALCLLGIDCEARLAYLSSTLEFAAANPGYEPLLRGAVHGLAVLGSIGNERALRTLFDVGLRSPEPMQGPIALGIGLVALRRADVVMKVLTARPDPAAAIQLLRDAFDLLSEDFEEERFALEVRKIAATSPEDSPLGRLAARVLTELEY